MVFYGALYGYYLSSFSSQCCDANMSILQLTEVTSQGPNAFPKYTELELELHSSKAKFCKIFNLLLWKYSHWA